MLQHVDRPAILGFPSCRSSGCSFNKVLSDRLLNSWRWLLWQSLGPGWVRSVALKSRKYSGTPSATRTWSLFFPALCSPSLGLSSPSSLCLPSSSRLLCPTQAGWSPPFQPLNSWPEHYFCSSAWWWLTVTTVPQPLLSLFLSLRLLSRCC